MTELGHWSTCGVVCILSVEFFKTLMGFMKPSVLLPAVGLPILQTGIRSCHLGTENPVVSRGTITRYSGLSSFSARSFGTDAAGVAPYQNTITLVMGEKGEKYSS